MSALGIARRWLPAGVAAAMALTGLVLLFPRAEGGTAPGSTSAGRRPTAAAAWPNPSAASPVRPAAGPDPASTADAEMAFDEFFESEAAPAPSTLTEDSDRLLKHLTGGTPAEQAAAALALRRHPTPEAVEDLLRLWHTSGDARLRSILLYVLCGTRGTVENRERDALLSAGAIPFLREVVRGPTGPALSPALLALSDLGTDEAARTLTAVVQDPREPAKSAKALTALAARPDRHAVAALEAMAREAGSRSTHLRAVGALLRITQNLTPAGADAPAEWIAHARRFVRTDGLDIVRAIAQDATLPDVQAAAAGLQRAIEALP